MGHCKLDNSHLVTSPKGQTKQVKNQMKKAYSSRLGRSHYLIRRGTQQSIHVTQDHTKPLIKVLLNGQNNRIRNHSSVTSSFIPCCKIFIYFVFLLPLLVYHIKRLLYKYILRIIYDNIAIVSSAYLKFSGN